jgi:hypothetical protein
MNAVDRYINSSIWFNVIRVENIKRHHIDDPFTKAFKQFDSDNSVSIDFDCSRVSKSMLAHTLQPHYTRLYFKFIIDDKEYSVFIFNADATYSYYRDNVFTVEFAAENVILNNIEVCNEYSRTL